VVIFGGGAVAEADIAILAMVGMNEKSSVKIENYC
jgi:hypothetical protein